MVKKLEAMQTGWNKFILKHCHGVWLTATIWDYWKKRVVWRFVCLNGGKCYLIGKQQTCLKT